MLFLPKLSDFKKIKKVFGFINKYDYISYVNIHQQLDNNPTGERHEKAKN